MKLAWLSLVGLLACGPTKPTTPSEPTTTTTATTGPPDTAPPPARPDPVALAKTALTLAVDPESKAKVDTRTQEGPQQTTIVRAMIAGASPGTGVRAALVTGDGTMVGPQDPAGFAELVRHNGWLSNPPLTSDLVQLANVALFDGILAVDDSVPPKVSGRPDALVLKLQVITYPSGAKDVVEVTVNTTGPAVTVITAAAKPPASRGPAGDLGAAIEADDAAAITLAIGALQRTTDPAGMAALARASTVPNETIAANAIMALSPTPESAKLLKEAWKNLMPEARAKLVALAGELHDATFAGQIK